MEYINQYTPPREVIKILKVGEPFLQLCDNPKMKGIAIRNAARKANINLTIKCQLDRVLIIRLS